jgi:FkbM family methyltransferase
VSFVEIGAHDGTQGDLLRPFILARPWTGVMVEPLPHLFERLRRNYAGIERVRLENAAISDHDGSVRMHYLPPVDDPEREGLPFWYDEIGSLSRAAVLRHRGGIPDLDGRLLSANVACMTFESLCARHEVAELDVLAIDAEGHDAVILGGVDFDVHRPQVVVYEHLHLGPRDRAECRAHLEKHGFETQEEGFNTWCIHERAADALHRTWRRLRWRVPGMSAHDEE